MPHYLAIYIENVNKSGEKKCKKHEFPIWKLIFSLREFFFAQKRVVDSGENLSEIFEFFDFPLLFLGFQYKNLKNFNIFITNSKYLPSEFQIENLEPIRRKFEKKYFQIWIKTGRLNMRQVA